MNQRGMPPPPSAGIAGAGPGTPGVPQTQPKRVALSWMCFLTILAAIFVFALLGGPWRLVNAVILAAGGVVLSLQALKPSLLPISRIRPLWYGLNSRTVPASRAYGTPFDRISRAAAAFLLFYFVVTTTGIAQLFGLGR
jgi:hypothetical protein